jgi:hypothetical protein
MLNTYRHQVTAVTMMLERELGEIESSVFPSVWEMTKSTDASKKLDKLYKGRMHLLI